MDALLVFVLLAPIARAFALDPPRAAPVIGAAVAGMALGATAAGLLADRHGRGTTVQLTLLVFSVGSLLSAAAPSYETLLAARVVTGLGLGGHLPVASTLVAELSPRAHRGRLVSILASSWALGTAAAGLVGLLVAPAYGWRGAFVVGALPALYALYLRRALPASPRYLASRGRLNEADAVVRRVERAGGAPLITLARPVAPAPVPTAGIADVWSRAFTRRTAMLWVVWAGVGSTVAVMVVSVSTDVPAGAATLFFVSALAQLPGAVSAGWLMDRWGRRPTLAIFLLGSASAELLFASAGGDADAVAYAALLAFFGLGTSAAAFTVTAEAYPTAVRASGVGVAASVGLVGGLVSAYLAPAAAAGDGPRAVAGLTAVLLVVAAGAVMILTDETRGRSLEALGEVRLSAVSADTTASGRGT